MYWNYGTHTTNDGTHGTHKGIHGTIIEHILNPRYINLLVDVMGSLKVNTPEGFMIQAISSNNSLLCM